MDKSKLRTPAEIAVIIALMVSMGVNYTNLDQAYPVYTCDIDTIPDMMCYKLSRVNDYGIQRYCYYDRDESRKFKQCTAGWTRITEANTAVDNSESESECKCKPIILAYTDKGRYICDGTGSDSQCYNEDMNPEKFENLGDNNVK